jgi:hypothetical protein
VRRPGRLYRDGAKALTEEHRCETPERLFKEEARDAGDPRYASDREATSSQEVALLVKLVEHQSRGETMKRLAGGAGVMTRAWLTRHESRCERNQQRTLERA